MKPRRGLIVCELFLHVLSKHCIELSCILTCFPSLEIIHSSIMPSLIFRSFISDRASDGPGLFQEVEIRERENAAIDIEMQGQIKILVYVSFAEIYNEQVFDLLEPLPKRKSGRRHVLQLREDKNGTPYIKGELADFVSLRCSLRSHAEHFPLPCILCSQAWKKFTSSLQMRPTRFWLLAREICRWLAPNSIIILPEGDFWRSFSCLVSHFSACIIFLNILLVLCSCSHCIFTVRMIKVVDKEDPHCARISMWDTHIASLLVITPHVCHYLTCLRLSFCDLAGSERYAKTQNLGDRIKEAGNINTSLLTLGRCITTLRHNQQNR